MRIPPSSDCLPTSNNREVVLPGTTPAEVRRRTILRLCHSVQGLASSQARLRFTDQQYQVLLDRRV
jgi:hypothetical protein